MDAKQLKKFEKFLFDSGVEVLTPTNEYEVIRFKANNNIGIVYKNKTGRVTKYTGEAQQAAECFLAKKPFACVNNLNRIRRPIIFRTLLKRDGNLCFYCNEQMNEGEETIEHLFSIRQGGTNHINNLALAHRQCNLIAANKSVVDKIKLRDQMKFKEKK